MTSVAEGLISLGKTHTENPSDFRFLDPAKTGDSGIVVLPYRKHSFACDFGWLKFGGSGGTS